MVTRGCFGMCEKIHANIPVDFQNPNLVIYSKWCQIELIYCKSSNSGFGGPKNLWDEKFFQKSIFNVFSNTIRYTTSAGYIRAAPPQLKVPKVLPRQQIRIFANFAKGIPMYEQDFEIFTKKWSRGGARHRIFPKFVRHQRALSPSSRGVRSSDYVRCKGLNVIFKKI